MNCMSRHSLCRLPIAVLLFLFSMGSRAQVDDGPLPADTLEPTDIPVVTDDSADWARVDAMVSADTTMQQVIEAATQLAKPDKAELRRLKLLNFRPNPKRALWLALVLPGGGQIYNRKYWKLPIIYGGFLGCTYALLWNGQMYRDYSQAYLDIMDDDPATQSYMDMLPPRFDITGREERFKTIFKNRKNRYRRYRDLSAFAFVGVYVVSIIDAYVDAQLSDFDISPELSLSVSPAVIDVRQTGHNKSAYGIGCHLNF